jgi:GNAT superfamily N-acetyltransferase
MRLLPAIELIVNNRFVFGSFVAPHPWTYVKARALEGPVVGWVGYGLSPLFDRIYVDDLYIEPEFRRVGYASSLLLAVTKACSTNGNVIPLTALHEVDASVRFWNRLRSGTVPGLVVTRDVRRTEMKAESRRWIAALVASA